MGEPPAAAGEVSSILVYPIKSCRGISVSQAPLHSTGFRWDRQWLVVNSNGRAYTQRVEPKFALVQVELPSEAFSDGWKPTKSSYLGTVGSRRAKKGMSGCNNHMTGNRDFFIELDFHSQVKFGDGKIRSAAGKGVISIQTKGGRCKIIDKKHNLTIAGFTDNDWADSLDDIKSTSGCLFCLGTKLISWCFKKQKSIALSSAEVGYIAATDAACEAIWLRRMLSDLEQSQQQPTIIHCDNMSAIAMTKNPVFHARSKHIELQHHFIRDLVNNGEISIEFVNNNDQPADILTKANLEFNGGEWSVKEKQVQVIRAPGMDELKVPLSKPRAIADGVSVWEWSGSAFDEGDEASKWFSDFIGKPITETRAVDPDYARGHKTMFADGYPFLLVSQGSLNTLNNLLKEPIPINRFRPNILVDGCEPFSEDLWKEIKINKFTFHGVKLCARCKATSNTQVAIILVWHETADTSRYAYDLGKRSPISSKFESSSWTREVRGEGIGRRGRSPHQDDRAPRRQDRSTTQKIRDMDTQIDTINTGLGSPPEGWGELEGLCQAFQPSRIRVKGIFGIAALAHSSYHDKVLMGAETRYLKIEKLAYALLTTSRKFRHYFQAHPITVLIDQPLKKILQRSDTSGQLLKWSIELSDFHISYQPRMAIKAQVLADFVAEFTHDVDLEPEITFPEVETTKEHNLNEDLAKWKLFVDRSSNQHGCGAGLVLQTPSGEQIEYTICIGFKGTNNEAEYEALLAGLKVATKLGVDSLNAFSDSQLVIFQIPKEENKKADSLANLALAFDFITDGNIPLEFLPNPSIEIAKEICQAELGEWSSGSHKQDNPKETEGEIRKIQEQMGRDLLSILWAYHTTSKIPTGEIPYSMLMLNLDLLDKKRERAEVCQAAYKHQVTKYYNQRVKHRSFLPGDLVLRKVTLSTKEPNAGKLGPTWEGPYKVVKVSRPVTYWLEDMSGKTLPHPWNLEHLKKYYQ
ncbi:molybdenum cofactor sulfurase family protein [Actinidia rufa]|uniref:Molybdenum cofactor sulfurase family protein n=1 Tax=Actinidia rufa TaxID=165716 RepID=A0A7J0EH45_9ERIC|nr:molybdenum cofactor sulfurase family protein [Actinidia rufa]